LPEYCEASGLRERAAHVANQQIEKKLLSLRQRKFLGGAQAHCQLEAPPRFQGAKQGLPQHGSDGFRVAGFDGE
jgi:hypothetical protein